jgi:hypothetical protein
VELPPYPETKTRPQPRKNKTAAIISSREGHELNGPMVLRSTNVINKALLGGLGETRAAPPHKPHGYEDHGEGDQERSNASSSSVGMSPTPLIVCDGGCSEELLTPESLFCEEPERPPALSLGELPSASDGSGSTK